MFNFFKQQPPKPTSPVESLIKRLGPFAAQLAVEHPKLLQLSPDPNRTILDIYVYNLWVCYHVASDVLTSELPNRESQEREQMVSSLRSALAIDSAQNAVPFLSKHFSFSPRKLRAPSIEEYVQSSLVAYDAAVADHDCPAWISAVAKLKAISGIPFEAIIADTNGEGLFTDEAAKVYARIEKTVLKEAKAILGK